MDSGLDSDDGRERAKNWVASSVVQAQLTWAVLVLAFLTGVINILGEFKPATQLSGNFLAQAYSVTLGIVYFGLLAGLLYSLDRLIVASAYIYRYGNDLKKSLKFEIQYPTGLWAKLIMDREGKIARTRVVSSYLVVIAVSIVLLIGRVLA